MNVKVTITFNAQIPIGGDLASATKAVRRMVSPERAWPQLACTTPAISVEEILARPKVNLDSLASALDATSILGGDDDN